MGLSPWRWSKSHLGMTILSRVLTSTFKIGLQRQQKKKKRLEQTTKKYGGVWIYIWRIYISYLLKERGWQREKENISHTNMNDLSLGFNSHICTWKTTALTRQIFVSKMMSLFFNMRPRSVIAFLPRSKRLLISWLQSPSSVILEPKKIKVCLCFHCFPISLPWSDGTGCHLSFLNVEIQASFFTLLFHFHQEAF